MCGLFFSTDKNAVPNLSDLTVRGPDENNTLTNDFGFFYHSKLITSPNSIKQPSKNNYGILLYNGTEYNLKENDTQYILDNLSDNIQHNLEFLKTLRGDFAICFVTESFVFLARDYFATKPLFFNIDKNNIIVASTELALKSCKSNPIRVKENSLYVIDKKTCQLINKFELYQFNLQQNVNSYDFVFENFEKSVLNKHTDDSFISLSSGYDTGSIAACLTKYKKNYNIITFPEYENKKIISERARLTKGKKIILDYRKISEGNNDIKKLPYYYFLKNEDDICSIVYASAKIAKKLNLRVTLTGNGGEDIFSDYSNLGKNLSHRSYFNGIFPNQLETVWPYIMKNNGSTYEHVPMTDYINGMFGIDSRHPLLDITLLQSFLNLEVKLKNNYYKAWMHFYMKELDYPFAFEKSAIGDNKIVNIDLPS